MNPLAVDDELRNRSLAYVLDEFVYCARCAFDINFIKRNVVLFEEVLGFAAIATPERCINRQIHSSIVARREPRIASKLLSC